jgi:catechol 2,3-dioxygenase-like lactoylglutathione lyase family enzyme
MIPPQNFSLAHIEQIAQPVKDLDRAVEFYRAKLGMTYLFASNGLAFFDCGGIRLMLSKPERAEFDHPGSVLYFKVADVIEAHEAMLTRGVEFIDEPHKIATMDTYDLWMAFFHDTEGNTLAITANIPHSG